MSDIPEVSEKVWVMDGGRPLRVRVYSRSFSVESALGGRHFDLDPGREGRDWWRTREAMQAAVFPVEEAPDE